MLRRTLSGMASGTPAGIPAGRPTVRLWTGRETRALRRALRMSVRAFAIEELGVAVRTVSKWEEFGESTVPRPDNQAILDTTLERADAGVKMRFQMLLAESGGAAAADGGAPRLPVQDYETWADDLDRVVVSLSRQNFAAATRLLERWLGRFPSDHLDGKGLYLQARSLVLLGDTRRDQGALLGPLSAQYSYRQACSMFAELDIPRRIAQIELSLNVVTEMTGGLQAAARRYQQLAGDERLGARDRARSLLWIGTALSKDGDHDYATRVMTEASHRFEDLGEAEDWSVAQQKLALAYRGAGDLGQALQLIDIARSCGTDDTPMQRVRLATAHAHILLTDKATCEHGLTMLDQTAQLAVQAGLSHQLRSIQAIRQGFEQHGFEQAGTTSR